MYIYIYIYISMHKRKERVIQFKESNGHVSLDVWRHHNSLYICILRFISIVPVGVRFRLLVQYRCNGEGQGTSDMS